MSVTIRRARGEDAGELIEYVRRLAAEPDSSIPLMAEEFTLTVEQEQEIIDRFAKAGNSVFLVAEMEGRIVGVLTCEGGERMARRHTAMLGISVRKGYRNQRIGTGLMQHLMAWARTSPLKRIELFVYTSNAPAIRLYRNFGFVVEGTRRGAIFQRGEYVDDYLMGVWVG